MKTLARKTTHRSLLRIKMAMGMLLLGAAIVLPIMFLVIAPARLRDPAVIGPVAAGILFLGAVGYFGFLRHFFLFCRLPDVQAETDGTYLYIHSTREAKIPLACMEGATLDASIPYPLHWEWMIRLLAEQYGTVTVKVPGRGTYRLYFVSGAKDVPDKIAAFAEKKLKDD